MDKDKIKTSKEILEKIETKEELSPDEEYAEQIGKEFFEEDDEITEVNFG